MQSGRIPPIFRQFFSAGVFSRADRDPHSDGQSRNESQAEQEATEEDAKAAAELLQNQEELKRQGLTATPAVENGKPCVLVRSGDGTRLRTIHGGEIRRLLMNLSVNASGPRLGRILDKRI